MSHALTSLEVSEYGGGKSGLALGAGRWTLGAVLVLGFGCWACFRPVREGSGVTSRFGPCLLSRLGPCPSSAGAQMIEMERVVNAQKPMRLGMRNETSDT